MAKPIRFELNYGLEHDVYWPHIVLPSATCIHVHGSIVDSGFRTRQAAINACYRVINQIREADLTAIRIAD